MNNELFEKIKNNNIVVLDIETSGINEKSSEIIKVEAIKLLNGKIVKKYKSYVRNRLPIDKEITRMTGISKKKLCTAPDVKTVLAELKKFVSDSIICFHNVDFDMKFLNFYAEQSNFSFPNERIDTLSLAKKIIKIGTIRFSLSELTKKFLIVGKTDCGTIKNLLFFLANSETLKNSEKNING